MRQVKIKLYKFEELDEKVQQSIIEKALCKTDFSEVYAADYEATLNEFEKMMGIKVYSWEVDSCGFHYEFNYTYGDFFLGDWNGDTLYAEDLTGKYLYRWLMNNVWDYIFPRRKYYKYESGWDNKKKRWNKQRYSRILRSNWGGCPLTGCCYDCDILEPIAKYLSTPYNKSYDLNDLIDDCLHKFFTTWMNDIEYCSSEDYVKEMILDNEPNEPMYLADGTFYHGSYEE